MKQSVVRYLLGILQAFLALNAFGGGYYGMTGAKGVSPELLEGSPFTGYFIPGLILFAVIGGSFLVSSIAMFAGWRRARSLTFIAAGIVLVWLAVQVAIIGYISWMQPTTAVIALIILGLNLIYRDRAA